MIVAGGVAAVAAVGSIVTPFGFGVGCVPAGVAPGGGRLLLRRCGGE